MEVKNNHPIDSTVHGLDLKKTQKAQQPVKESGSKDAIGSRDRVDYAVELSNKAKELNASYDKAFEIAKNTSPIREEKVAELKKKIANGQYSIDSGKIADGIIREAVKEHLALTDRG